MRIVNALAAALLLVPAAFGPAAAARTGDGASDADAARTLCVSAERALEDADRGAPADPELRKAARRDAVAKLEAAIPRWRAAGDLVDLAKTYERLGELYGAWDTPEGERALDAACALWGELGRYREQADVLHRHGVWYASKRDYDAAVAQLLREADLRKEMPEPRDETQAYSMIAAIRRVTGDEAQAKEYEALAERSARADREAVGATRREPEPATPRPDAWADFASSPVRSEVEVVEGRSWAELVNRSGRDVAEIRIGCVAETDGRARVLGELTTELGPSDRDGGPFESIARPATKWSDEPTRCEAGARMAVVRVLFADGSAWSLDGEPWVVVGP